MKFSSTSNTSVVCRDACIPYFKINAPIFCFHLFSQNYLNPQARFNKMVNKYTVDYRHSPSQLTSRIHLLIFLWTPKGLISLLEIVSKPVYSTMVAEKFQIYSVKITGI